MDIISKIREILDNPIAANVIYILIIIACFYLLYTDDNINDYYEMKARLCPFCM